MGLRKGISQFWRLVGAVITVMIVSTVGTAVLLNAQANKQITELKKPSETANANRRKPKSPGTTAITVKSPTSKSSTTKTFSPAYKLTHTSGLGLYSGPGKINEHEAFAEWLNRPINYATDYIDYKGGWQKDFIDSRLWLSEPWGRWTKKDPARKLVLGVPMLQNADSGKFDEGANGAYDSYFKELGQNLVDNGLGDSIIRLGYEANNDSIGPWQANDNPEGYKRQFRHIVNLMRSIPNSNFTFDWTVCVGYHPGRALSSFESFYPGNDVVDMVGIDIYDVKWNDTKTTPEQRWHYSYNRKMGVGEFISFARSKGKPITIPEWGLYAPGDNFAGGGDNPYFIQKMVELINATKPVYQSYFNIDWGGKKLNDFPSGKAEFKKLFGG